MTKLEFEKLLKPLIEIIDDIELDILENMVNRIDNYDGVKGSLEWYTDKLTELKVFDKENNKVFKNNKQKLKDTLKEILNSSGNHINNFDKLESYYNDGKIDINPSTLYDSKAIKTMITEAFKDTTDIMDLIQTKAIEGVNKDYKRILNKAYIETATGVYTYTESIRRALDEYAVKGIDGANYENGMHLSIESVVRRDVRTRVNKLVGDVELEHAKELNTNLVYVDQHLGARIRTKYMTHDYEAHAEWQGKKYMIDGSSKEYPNFYESTGYGEMLGLKGINCYHDFYPTFPWEEIPDIIDEVENAEKYKLLQEQRTYERKIRGLKREKLVARKLNDVDKLKDINKKMKKTNNEFDSWLKENNLTRDYNREYVSRK